MATPKRSTKRRRTPVKGDGKWDVISKYGTFIGILLIAYLQTLFPSKEAFLDLERKLNDIDKRLIEITFIQNNVTLNTAKIQNIEERMRLLEIEIARMKSAGRE